MPDFSWRSSVAAMTTIAGPLRKRRAFYLPGFLQITGEYFARMDGWTCHRSFCVNRKSAQERLARKLSLLQRDARCTIDAEGLKLQANAIIDRQSSAKAIPSTWASRRPTAYCSARTTGGWCEALRCSAGRVGEIVDRCKHPGAGFVTFRDTPISFDLTPAAGNRIATFQSFA